MPFRVGDMVGKAPATKGRKYPNRRKLGSGCVFFTEANGWVAVFSEGSKANRKKKCFYSRHSKEEAEAKLAAFQRERAAGLARKRDVREVFLDFRRLVVLAKTSGAPLPSAKKASPSRAELAAEAPWTEEERAYKAVLDRCSAWARLERELVRSGGRSSRGNEGLAADRDAALSKLLSAQGRLEHINVDEGVGVPD